MHPRVGLLLLIALLSACDDSSSGSNGDAATDASDGSNDSSDDGGVDDAGGDAEVTCGTYTATYTPDQCSAELLSCLNDAADAEARDECYAADEDGEACRRCVLDSGYECYNENGCADLYDAWQCCAQFTNACDEVRPELCEACADDYDAYDACTKDHAAACITAGIDCFPAG